MSGDILQSERHHDAGHAQPSRAPANADPLAAIRVDGGLTATFGGAQPTRVRHLAQWGGWRLKLPRTTAAGRLAAIAINTGGGLAGGDRVTNHFSALDGADVMLTSASAERVYRALGDQPTRLTVTLGVGAGSRLAWCPQETILYDGGRLARRIEADLRGDGVLVLCEMVAFGRSASGETVRDGSLTDHWRLSRDGRLVFAESIRLTGDIDAALTRQAVAGGATVAATILMLAHDAVDHLTRVRGAIAGAPFPVAASAWRTAGGGVLAVRALAGRVEPLKLMCADMLSRLTGAPVSRVWQC